MKLKCEMRTLRRQMTCKYLNKLSTFNYVGTVKLILPDITDSMNAERYENIIERNGLKN